MAKRKALFHDEEAKARIQTTQLIKRLNENALAKKEFMTPGQIQSANILLKKRLPDMKANDMKTTLDVTDPLAELIKYVADRGKRAIKTD